MVFEQRAEDLTSQQHTDPHRSVLSLRRRRHRQPHQTGCVIFQVSPALRRQRSGDRKDGEAEGDAHWQEGPEC